MARQPVKLGRHVFRTKSDARDWVKSLLNSVEPDVGELVPVEGDSLDAMIDVFLRHPGFDRKFPDGIEGIEGVYIRRSEADGGRTKQFIYRLKGCAEVEDISYYKCFGKTDSYRRNCAFATLRRAVKNDCLRFKHGLLDGRDGGVCALSGLKFPKHELAADHAEPFSALVARWCAENGTSLEELELEHLPADEGGCRLLERELEATFIEWHRKNARLQLVNKTLNMRLKDKDKDSPEAQDVIKAFIAEQTAPVSA